MEIVTMGALRNLLAMSLALRGRAHGSPDATEGLPPDAKTKRAPFDHVLNWRLLHGSHDFPGPDGGTCLNEAAVVATGLPYRAIARIEDLPSCFSPVIGAYVIRLNDAMPDEPRQKLLPYVTRLAGTADDFVIECRRAECVALAAVRVFAANALRRAGWHDYAAAWAAVRDLDAAVALLPKWEVNRSDRVVSLRPMTKAAWSAAVGASECHKYGSLCVDVADNAADAAMIASRAAVSAVNDTEAQHEVWYEALAALDDMLAIGKQAEPVEPALAHKRMENAKSAAFAVIDV